MNLHRLLLPLLLVAALAGVAHAKHVRFVGPHPVAARYGGGYCYIDAPHMHDYQPDHAGLYQQVGDGYVFTGDPTPFGYEGERHVFVGHHPMAVAVESPEPVICFIDGPHYHAFAPPSGPAYQIKDGAAFYVGAMPPAYVRMRPHRVRVVNDEYRPYVAMRPVVTVEPPVEWHGDVYIGGPAVRVHGPGVVVGPPPVYVGPPRVVIGAPQPVFVGPQPVFIERGEGGERRRHREHDDDDEGGERRGGWHHDNGRHEGWEKHGRK